MAENRRRSAARKLPPLTPRLQQYACKSLEEVTEELVRLVEGGKRERLGVELQNIVFYLKAHKLRNVGNAHAFRVGGGLTALLRLTSQCKERERDLVLLLGTLGNLCALERETRSCVMGHPNALQDIMHVLRSSETPAVLNTSVRVVANLAQDEENIGTILLCEHKIMKVLTQHLLTGMADSACKQSILRAIRILCSDAECREELKSSEGFVPLSACLKSGEEEVAIAASQAVWVILQDGDPDCIQQLSVNGALPSLVKLCAHPKPKVSALAVKVLLQCTKNSDGRVALGSAGGVETLVGYLDCCAPSSPLFQEITSAVCTCCREVISRQRLRDCGGLERLIEMLAKPEFASLHMNILSALICYYFDENTLKFMVKKLGLLKALTYHLQEMSKRDNSAMDQPEADTTESQGDAANECATGEVQEEQEKPAEMEAGNCVSSTVHGEADSDSQSASHNSCLDKSGSQDLSESSKECSSLASADDACIVAQKPLSTPEELATETDSQSTNSEEGARKTEATESSSSIEVDESSSASPIQHSSLEDAFAAPPPARRPRLQLDFESSTPMPVNFIESLLSSPNPYQKQPKLESPFPGDLATSLENQVVLMLSRVSHLRECITNLASPEVQSAILGYFFSQELPNVHSFKVLTRIFKNPHCFQDCITSLVPSTIYKHLILPVGALQGDCFEREQQLSVWASPPPLADFDLVSVSPGSPAAPRRQSGDSLFGYSPLHFAPSPISGVSNCLSISSSGRSTLNSMCRELLERLSKVAESPYGQGVLAHMLLRGGEKEKEASCLALPLLCRTPRICQKMMVGYKGLQILTDLASSEERGEQQMMAIDSLLTLAQNVGHKRRGSFEEEGPPPAKKRRLDPPEGKCSPPPTDTSLCFTATPSHCKYRDSDHCPFDLIIVVGNAENTARLPVHRSCLMESSKVFAVMLGGQYQESSLTEICIKDVPPLAFKSLVHHAYGCGWPCPSVLDKILHSETPCSDFTQDCDPVGDLTSRLTQPVVEEVVASFDFLEDRRQARHCLQALACASRFLLPELCAQCEHSAASYLTPTNVVAMFHFSQLHQSLYLAERCLHLMVALPHSELRRRVFTDLLSSPEGPEALKMLKTCVTGV